MVDITITGKIITPKKLQRAHSCVSVAAGKTSNTIHIQYTGLLVAYHGGNDEDKKQNLLAAKIAKGIARCGGINMHGGKSHGIMGAVKNAAPKASFGILAKTQLEHEKISGNYAAVESKHTRLEILATMPPYVIIFKGGIGTMQELTTVLTMWKDQFSGIAPYPAPQPFISAEWKPILRTMEKYGALSDAIAKQITFFTKADDVLKKIIP